MSYLNRMLSALIIIVMLVTVYAPAVEASVVYGPVEFQRNTGAPGAVTSQFSSNPSHGNYTMYVRNGEITNGCSPINGASSAIVRFNGNTIFSTKDFNQNTYLLKRNVTLQNLNNLAVDIRSIPGSHITTWIEDEFADIVITSPKDDLTSSGTILLSGYTIDRSVQSISIDQNGIYITIPVTNGNFSTNVTVSGPTQFMLSAQDSTGTVRQASLSLDGDLLTEKDELKLGFDPLNPDSDSSLTTASESGNGVLDGIEALDGGQLPAFVKAELGCDPLKQDTDDDGLTDYFEIVRMGTLTDPISNGSVNGSISDALKDRDNDGLTNIEEQNLGTDPLDGDSDKDGLLDGFEVKTFHSNPLNKYSDNDSLDDGAEQALHTDPNSPDSDGNGVPDGDETYTSMRTDDGLGISINITGKGYLAQNVSVSLETSDYYSNISALISPVVNVDVDGAFDSAAVTLNYTPNATGNPSHFTLAYYDESQDLYVPVPTTVDTVNHTLTATFSHFCPMAGFDGDALNELYTESSQFNEFPAQGGATVAYIAKKNRHERRDVNWNRYTVEVLDVKNNTIATAIPVQNPPFDEVVSDDGKFLYISNYQNVSVVDTATNLICYNFTAQESIGPVTLSPDGNRLYAGSWHNLYCFNTLNRSMAGQVSGIDCTTGLTISKDGLYIFSVDKKNCSLDVIDSVNYTRVKTIRLLQDNEYVYRYYDIGFGCYAWNCGVASGADVSPDGEHVYVGIVNNTKLSVINVQTLTLENVIPLQERSVYDVVISKDGKRIYASNGNYSISVIDAVNQVEINRINTNSSLTGGAPQQLSLSSDNRYLFVSRDRGISESQYEKPEVISFNRTTFTAYQDQSYHCKRVYPVDDGGYMAFIDPSDSGDRVEVRKYNESGGLIATYSYSRPLPYGSYGSLIDAVHTDDGGYVILVDGGYWYYNHNTRNPRLFKIDSNGNILWDRNDYPDQDTYYKGFDFYSRSEAYLCPADNGNFVMGRVIGNNDSVFIFRKFDSNGNIVLSRNISLGDRCYIDWMSCYSDGSYLISLIKADSLRTLIIKLDGQGNELMRLNLSDLSDHQAYGYTAATNDGGFVVINANSDYLRYTYNITTTIIKYDANGRREWRSNYSYYDLSPRSIIPLSDGGYIIDSEDILSWNSRFLIRLNDKGQRIWDYGYYGDARTYGLDNIVESSPGHYMIVGSGTERDYYTYTTRIESILLKDPSPKDYNSEIIDLRNNSLIPLDINGRSACFSPVTGSFDLTDSDNDGLPDVVEEHGFTDKFNRSHITDPNNPDSDYDGLLDGDEVVYSTGSTGSISALVSVADGLSSAGELVYDSGNADFADYSSIDYIELSDDAEAVNNAGSIDFLSYPDSVDSDGDGIDDPDELDPSALCSDAPSNPFLADTDSDWMKDGTELKYGSYPTETDSDSDGYDDPYEVYNGVFQGPDIVPSSTPNPLPNPQPTHSADWYSYRYRVINDVSPDLAYGSFGDPTVFEKRSYNKDEMFRECILGLNFGDYKSQITDGVDHNNVYYDIGQLASYATPGGNARDIKASWDHQDYIGFALNILLTLPLEKLGKFGLKVSDEILSSGEKAVARSLVDDLSERFIKCGGDRAAERELLKQVIDPKTLIILQTNGLGPDEIIDLIKLYRVNVVYLRLLYTDEKVMKEMPKLTEYVRFVCKDGGDESLQKWLNKRIDGAGSMQAQINSLTESAKVAGTVPDPVEIVKLEKAKMRYVYNIKGGYGEFLAYEDLNILYPGVVPAVKLSNRGGIDFVFKVTTKDANGVEHTVVKVVEVKAKKSLTLKDLKNYISKDGKSYNINYAVKQKDLGVDYFRDANGKSFPIEFDVYIFDDNSEDMAKGILDQLPVNRELSYSYTKKVEDGADIKLSGKAKVNIIQGSLGTSTG